ncbi:LysR family transcriptional regulator [Sphingomonas bisphenolicum]|uniref:LysR family transcriptional regulator n=1 Tax=Sphingomonas bisphenolicum TaxID=296544 RepID=A0ABM7GA94_9SPHN|nr:LysR family transcriptional regulator [Sphingomonas bisphenolicum]BBF72010.1 LysR family transcriptional regulator [Sphingomonas bisphenolicum]
MDDIGRLDLNLLLLLDALQEDMNLSASARRLRISQPTASANLQKLREFFGDQLFVRTGRGMKPTPFAEMISDPVRQSLDIVRKDVVRKARFEPAISDRVIRITTSDVGVMIFIPPLLDALREAAPSMNVQVVPVPHDLLEKALEQNEVDVAIGYFPDLTGPNIMTQALFDHSFACLVSAQHSTITERLSLEQFLAADHIVINEQGRSQELFERRLHELGMRRRVRLHLPHFMSVPQLVASSEMIATVPMSLGVWYQNAGIKVFPTPVESPLIQLRQFWHRRLNDDPMVTWLHRLLGSLLIGKDPALAFSEGYSSSTDRTR